MALNTLQQSPVNSGGIQNALVSDILDSDGNPIQVVRGGRRWVFADVTERDGQQVRRYFQPLDLTILQAAGRQIEGGIPLVPLEEIPLTPSISLLPLAA